MKKLLFQTALGALTKCLINKQLPPMLPT